MNNWKTTNFHLHAQSEDVIKLENGKYYEIGFECTNQIEFIHQGIRQFKYGFHDDAGYLLKPSPTHAKEIILSKPEIIDDILIKMQLENHLAKKSINETLEMLDDIQKELNNGDQIDLKERSLLLKVTFDWQDYDDVSDELLLEDSGILDNLKEGVNIEII